MSRIRVAIVGCGRISDLHLKAYESVEDGVVTVLCDKNLALVREKQKEWGIPGGTDNFEDILNDPDIDAVEILTPQKLHEEMVLKALRAGKHVAVQKPMTIDLKSADRLIEEADKGDRIFKITENYVTYPPIVQAKKLILDGAIGDPINFRLHLIAAGRGGWEIPKATWEWRMQELLEDRGQETFDHGHHLWSTAWYLMGEFSEVTSWIDSFQDMVDAPDVIMWKHAGVQRYGSCSISYCNEMHIDSDYYPNDEWMDIAGTKGLIRINRCTGKLMEGPVLSLYSEGGWTHFEEIPSDWQLGFTGAAENFIRSIQGREEPFPDARQGRAILAMNMAIQKSSARRRSVYLKELDARIPGLYALRKRHEKIREDKRRKAALLRDCRGEKGLQRLESRAEDLTMRLPDRLIREETKGWNALIGLILKKSCGGEDLFFIRIEDGSCSIGSGEFPENPHLIIRVPKAVWAAILMGKKKIQTAFIQGKFKMEGDLEYSFKIKSAFGL